MWRLDGNLEKKAESTLSLVKLYQFYTDMCQQDASYVVEMDVFKTVSTPVCYCLALFMEHVMQGCKLSGVCHNSSIAYSDFGQFQTLKHLFDFMNIFAKQMF